jgi:hypothetical protein
MDHSARTRALLALALPAADSARYDEVHRLLDSAGVSLDARGLTALRERAGGTVRIVTDPSGAVIQLRRVKPIATLPERAGRILGHTPVTDLPLVAGEYLLHIRDPRAEQLDALVEVRVGQASEVRHVLETDGANRGLIRVAAGRNLLGASVPDFFIGRTEVTNEEFQRFVSAGGYRSARLWPDTMIVRGQRVPRDAALAGFVDRTGLGGPRAWSGARFPNGMGDHPVTGVSWYEANAYARWAGGRLPTGNEWWRAALADGTRPFPWGGDGATVDSRANFGLTGTAPVATHPTGVSPFGCHDMAGNVREWLADEARTPGRYMVAGGSWQDPSYMFEHAHSEHFEPAFSNAAIGFRIARPLSR